MAITINNKVYRNLQEQVGYLTGEVENLTNDVKKSITQADLNNAITSLENAVSEEVSKLYEATTLNFEIQITDWVDKEYTLSNELFKSTNIIFVSPAPDNGTTINDNLSYYGSAGVQATEIIEQGKLTLKATNVPANNIFVQVLVMNPASIVFE